MMISHSGTVVPKFKPPSLWAPIQSYLKGCNRQGQEWVFDQLAKLSHGILLLLAGLISEATTWF